jgi:hypothetical protein
MMRHYVLESEGGQDVKLYSFSNRGYPEYETSDLPPPPNGPIEVTLDIKDYSAHLANIGNGIQAEMIGAGGKVRLVAFDVVTTHGTASVDKGAGKYDFSLPADAVEMNSAVNLHDTHVQGSMVLVHCFSGRTVCSALGSARIHNGEATLHIKGVGKGLNSIVLFTPRVVHANAVITTTAVGMYPHPLEPWHERADGERWGVEGSRVHAAALEIAEDANASATAYLPAFYSDNVQRRIFP